MIRLPQNVFRLCRASAAGGQSILHDKVHKVYTPIKTTLTLIEDGQTRLGIISSHFICEFYCLSNLLSQARGENPGIPRKNTFFFSSHNHTDALLARGTERIRYTQYDACCSEDALTPEGRTYSKAL